MVLRCGLHAGAHADVLVGIGVLQAATIQQGAQQFAKGAFRVWIFQARNKCLGYPLGRVVCTFNPPWDFVSIPPLLVVRTLLIALRKHRRQKPLRQLLLCGGLSGALSCWHDSLHCDYRRFPYGAQQMGCASIRGRLDYAADHALFYLTGGAAFVSNETSVPTTGISIGGDGTRVGWTVGLGLDYAFTNNWFTGIEYRYSQYESKTFTYPIPILNLGFVGFKQELSNNQVTARIGYKF